MRVDSRLGVVADAAPRQRPQPSRHARAVSRLPAPARRRTRATASASASCTTPTSSAGRSTTASGRTRSTCRSTSTSSTRRGPPTAVRARRRGRPGRPAAGSVGQLGARQPRPAALRLAGVAPVATRRGSACCMLLTLRGTPTIYYGEEIGMVDVPVADRRFARSARAPRARPRSRSGSAHRCSGTPRPTPGFTAPDATPWLPLAPDADRVNVAGSARGSRLDPRP